MFNVLAYPSVLGFILGQDQPVLGAAGSENCQLRQTKLEYQERSQRGRYRDSSVVSYQNLRIRVAKRGGHKPAILMTVYQSKP
jgi:hypothetical protein